MLAQTRQRLRHFAALERAEVIQVGERNTRMATAAAVMYGSPRWFEIPLDTGFRGAVHTRERGWYVANTASGMTSWR